ncbi:PP0621 family protein [Nautilia lithotrophica]
MGKIILFIIIGIAIYFFFIKSREITKNEKENDENEFVQCEKCGTFVLKKEMKEKNGKLLCKDCYANS